MSTLQDSLYGTDRELRSLRRRILRFTTPSRPGAAAACYVALWRLPRPDFHRLVIRTFQGTPARGYTAPRTRPLQPLNARTSPAPRFSRKRRAMHHRHDASEIHRRWLNHDRPTRASAPHPQTTTTATAESSDLPQATRTARTRARCSCCRRQRATLPLLQPGVAFEFS